MKTDVCASACRIVKTLENFHVCRQKLLIQAFFKADYYVTREFHRSELLLSLVIN